jgi:hypothetical protein
MLDGIFKSHIDEFQPWFKALCCSAFGLFYFLIITECVCVSVCVRPVACLLFRLLLRTRVYRKFLKKEHNVFFSESMAETVI